MENHKLILADLLIFGLIAFVAAIFGYSGATGDVSLIGRVVCYVAIVLAALALVVKRPPTGSR